MSEKVCRECGSELGEVRAITMFCSNTCRQTFNNRRAQRGAVLYDLWMTQRYDRPAAKALKILALMCALGKQYREEDIQRAGHMRKSWMDAGAVLHSRPRLRLKTMSVDTVQESEGSQDGG